MRKLSKILALVLVLMMTFAVVSAFNFTTSAANIPGGTKLYLAPSANWNQSNARFAAYFFGNGEAWVSMTKVAGESNLYEVTVPAGSWTNVIFCRMNPSASANNWNNKWNQTADLVYNGTSNCYTVKEGTWDKGGGTWSTYGSACAHTNVGAAATCTKDQLCLDCGDPVASALGHTYNSAHLCTRCNEQATFTVAGNGAHLGTEFDTGNTANDMTYADGVYTKVYTNVAAGSYKLKVARDHDWGTAYPSADKAYTVATAGSTVTVTLKGTTVTITVDAPHTHSFSDATCTEPSKCECGETQGEALGHTWVDATYSAPKTCSVCAATEGEALSLPGAGTEEDPFVIGSLEALVAFRDSVNAGETKYNAEGVYVSLGADIDMSSVDWSVNIGDDCNATFDGIFDGKGYKLSNLNATETAKKADGYVCGGLFGAIYGKAVIKNLTIENVSIDAGEFTGNNVAAVVGFVYAGKGSIENVTVCGNIEINASGIYGVGAIVGYSYSSNFTIKDCKVVGADGSYIKGTGAAGIIGYANGAHLVNAEVSGLSIEGTGLVGGLVGISSGTTGVNGATVSNVVLAATKDLWVHSTGVAIGTISTYTLEITGVVYENVTGADTLLGSAYAEKPTTVVPAIVARIGNTYYSSLQEALNVGGEVVLLSDIGLTDNKGVTIPKGVTVVLDLNGFTLSYESDVMGEAMITNKGELTINDSVGTGVINYNYIGANDASYGKGNYTISNGGTLTVNGGKITIANLRQHAKYPIDNNSTTGDAILVINGGHLYNYNTSAIRMFCNSTTYKNSVTINGGLIEGYSAIWMQNPGKNTVNGDLTITGGEIRTTAAAYVNGTATVKEVSSSMYTTIDGDGGAWSESSFVNLAGGTFNENVNLYYDAPANVTIGDEAVFNGNLWYVCNHAWIDATCTAPKTCSVCGETEGEALGHDIVVDAAVDATCIATGLTAGEHCANCDYKVAQEVVPALGHDIVVDAAVDATCTATGLTAGEHCSRCDHKVAQTVVPALAHNYVNGTCDVCNINVIYFVNVENWTKVNAYMWDGTNNGWPGVAMTKTGEQVNGHDIYKVEYTAAYVNIIFNNGSVQTADLVIAKGKYFCPLNSIWYESASDVPSFEGITKTNYYLPGGFNNWKDANAFLKEGTSTVIRSYVSLAANTTYEFKVKTGNTWYGSTGTVSATSSTITFSTTGTNAKITTTCAGLYIFEYNTSTKKLTVIYPHVEEILPGKDATCTETGLTEGKKCSVCGTVTVKQTTIDALGHDIVVDVEAVAPTCTATGLTVAEHCTRCDHKVEQTVVDALGHTAGDAATCTTAQTCTVCNAELVAALGHKYENCVCTRCEAVLPTLGQTDAFDFTTADGLNAALASGKLGYTGTFRNNGDSHQFAADSSIQFVVPANTTVTLTGHSTGYGVFDVYVNGVKHDMAGALTFTVTEETKVVIVPNAEATYSKAYLKGIALAEYVDRTITSDTTITFGSEGNYKDSLVDFSGIQIGDNGGNNSQVKNGSFDLLLKAGSKVIIHGYSGYTSYKLNGGEEITSEYYTYLALEDTVLTVTPVNGNNYFYSIEITLHTGVTLVDAKAATCTEAGHGAYYVCDCHENALTDKGEVAALGHDIVVDAAVDATCTATGLTAGEHCSRCDHKVEQTVVDALGHDMVVDAAVDATCTTTGLTAGEHCSRCDHKVAQTEVPALGHDIVVDAAVDATCTATGLTAGEHCSRCDHKVAQTEVPALGHNYYYNLCLACGAANPHFIYNFTTVGENKLVCNEYHLVDTDTHKKPYQFTLVTIPEDGLYIFTADATKLGVFIYTIEINTEGADFSVGGASWAAVTFGQAELKAGQYYLGFIFHEGVGEYDLTITKHEHAHEAVVTAPTCTSIGYTTYTCACGDTYTADEVAALEHEYVDGACTVCGGEDPNYVAPQEPAVEPTFFQKILTWFVDLVKKLLAMLKR